MNRIYMVLVAACVVAATSGQRNPAVCSPNQQEGMPPPRIPDNWSSRVEITDVQTKLTRTAHVHYSYSLNAAAIWYKGFYREWEARIYLYNTSEHISFVYDNSDCKVRPIGADSIFGLEYVNGRPHIARPEKTFKLNDGINPTTYAGKKRVRGINTHQWNSCVYDASQRSTSDMYWDFTNPSMSYVGYFNNTVPARVTTRGKSTGAAGQIVDFNTEYSFFDFNYDIEPEKFHFQIPRGIYCKDMQKGKEKPMPRKAFRMRQETVEPTMKVSSSMSEWYDFEKKIVRFDLKPVWGSKWGFNPIKMIHDFNTGVAYIIDKEIGNCSAVPISKSSTDVVKSERDRNLVRIKTISELFFENLDWTYVGQRLIRGIKCDSWNAMVHRVKSNSTYIYEWHFTSDDWLDASTGRRFQRGAPVMLETIIQEYEYPTIYHFYDYVEEEPDTWAYGLGPCYTLLRRVDYRFDLPGSYSKLAQPKPNRFKYYVLDAVMKSTGGISPLRVNDIQVKADDNDRQMTVSFNLLDVAPVKGDTVVGVRPEVSLDAAMASLNTAIRTYKFIVMFKPNPDGDETIELPAVPNSLTVSGVRDGQLPNPNVKSVGYSSGAMGALALGMILLGMLAGTGFAYWFFFIRS